MGRNSKSNIRQEDSFRKEKDRKNTDSATRQSVKRITSTRSDGEDIKSIDLCNKKNSERQRAEGIRRDKMDSILSWISSRIFEGKQMVGLTKTKRHEVKSQHCFTFCRRNIMKNHGAGHKERKGENQTTKHPKLFSSIHRHTEGLLLVEMINERHWN